MKIAAAEAGAVLVPVEAEVAAEAKRIDSIEQKIEAAKRDLEDAEKELGEIKKTKNSNP